MKKLLWTLFSLCLLLFLMPANTREVKASSITPELHIGNIAVTMPDSGYYTCGNNTVQTVTGAAIAPVTGSSATWWVHNDGTTYTLTLNDASIATPYLLGETVTTGIYTKNMNLNLVLAGNNQIGSASNYTTDKSSYGIYCFGDDNIYGNLAISGNGELSVSAENVSVDKNKALSSYGIYCFNNLTITGACTVEVTAGDITKGYFNYDFSPTSTGILTANEGSSVTISDGAKVIASGGVHNSSSSIGLDTKSAYISGSSLTANGGDANTSSFGIQCVNIILSHGANVSATSGPCGGYYIYENSIGLVVASDGLSITDSNLTLKTTVNGGYYGAFSNPNLNLNFAYQWRSAQSGSFSTSEYIFNKIDTYVEFKSAIPITDITMTNATSINTNTDLQLTGTGTPTDATNHTIVWSVAAANGTGASVSGSTFRATTAGTATVKATITNGTKYEKTFNITVTEVINLVTDITMTNSTSVQANTDLPLMGTIAPVDATKQSILWSVANANGTGASISGSTFRATTAGTATVRATITDGLGEGINYVKTFNITVTAASENNDNGVNSGYSGNSPTTKTEGKLEKDQKYEQGVPMASLGNSSDDLKADIFTPAELARVAAGEDAKVLLKVTDISATVSDEDKQKIEEKLGKATKVIYLDLSLYKQVGDAAQTRVTETADKIKISIEIPQELWCTDAEITRAYRVVRVHDGVPEILEGTYDSVTHLFTFETDRFSTYALTYLDTKSNTKNNVAGANRNDGTAGNAVNKAFKDFYHLRLSAKSTQTSQTLTFAKMAGADGYLIYGAGIKEGDKLIKLAEIAANITSYTQSKLEPATYYQYQVKAFRLIDGKKVTIATSKVVYAVTEGYADPIKVAADAKALTLKVGKTGKVTCRVILPKGTKMNELTTDLRYESSNKKLATVNSNGIIKAVAKGSCYIYAYTQNGVYTRIKITVV